MMDFLNFGFIDILDIAMVAVIIFVLFRWMKGSSAMNIFLAIVFLLVVRLIVVALGMKMMSSLMETVIDVGLISLIVIFQPELRQFLNRIGANSGISRGGRELIKRIFGKKEELMEGQEATEVAEACWEMGEQKTGALIVIPHKTSLDYIIQTGDMVDAIISKRLIMNIFFKNSPLHDGAMILGSKRIIAARCTLPITSRTDIPASFGMRHKAAIGISEESDADVIVVSEETGNISFIRNGEVTKIEKRKELVLLLATTLENKK